MTASKAALRAVPAGARAPLKPKLLSVLEAAESGDYLAELVALRRRIATAVTDPNTPARDLASLTRRQLEISKEINSIRASSEGDEVGEAADTPDEDFAL